MTSLFVIDPSNKKDIVASAKTVFNSHKEYKEFREGCFESSTSTHHHTVVKGLKNLKVKFYHAQSANKEV